MMYYMLCVSGYSMYLPQGLVRYQQCPSPEMRNKIIMINCIVFHYGIYHSALLQSLNKSVLYLLQLCIWD